MKINKLKSSSETEVSSTTCFDNCTHPNLKDGDIVNEGFFLRNFNATKEIGRRYNDDQEGKFGFKVKTDFLKTNPIEQMSVNCQDCSKDIQCSPVLQMGHPQKIQNSVAIIDLTKIREIMQEDCLSPVHAVYKPIGENIDINHPGNPCHFDLECEDIGLSIKAALRKCLQGDWIPKKKPKDPAEVKKVLESIARHRSVIDFHFEVIEESKIRPN